MSAPAGRYVALDSLRGICACAVVMFHCSGQSHLFEFLPIRHGWLFVDFFFVLSGFVIATSYRKRLASGFGIAEFMWLRFWRVYPLHLAVLVAFVLFEIGTVTVLPAGIMNREAFTGVNSADGLVASFFLVQIFFGPDAAWNLPAWSISAEIWTYLIFAFLFRFGGRLLVPICLCIAIAAVIILLNSDRYMNAVHDNALLRCVFGFAMGVVAWRLAPNANKFSFGGDIAETAVELIMIVIVGGFLAIFGVGPSAIAAPFVFLLAVLVFSRQRGAVSRFLMTAAPARLGQLSFSIYMIHMFILYRVLNGLSLLDRMTNLDLYQSVSGATASSAGAWIGDAFTLLSLATVILCAEVTYRFIETPGQRFGRAQLQRRLAKAPPSTSQVAE